MKRILVLGVVGVALLGCGARCEETSVVTVSSAAEMRALEACETMAGQLTVQQADDILEFSLPRLRRIAGPISFNGNPNLTSVKLDALQTADDVGIERAEQLGITFQLNPKLETVSLQALTTVGAADTRPAGLSFSGEALTRVEVPALETLHGGVHFDQTRVTEVALPRLTRLTTLSFARNAVLSRVSLPQLEELTQGMGFTQVPLLTKLELPALAQVGTEDSRGGVGLVETGVTALELPLLRQIPLSFTLTDNSALARVVVGGAVPKVGVFEVKNNDALTILSAARLLEVGTLRIVGNANLVSVDLTDLRKVDGFEVVENVKLSTCEMNAVVARVKSRGGVRDAIVENNKVETCGG
jgi:hypothetical protein